MTRPKKRAKIGLVALKRRVAIHGLATVDKRTSGARVLFAWKQELLNALGGAENVSPQKKTLVELATRTKLMLDHVDEYLLSLPTLIVRRHKKIIPAVGQRMQLADSLQRTLLQLGLERQFKPAENLLDYSARRARELREGTATEEETTDEKPKPDDPGSNE